MAIDGFTSTRVTGVAVAALLGAVALALGACGGDETPAVCGSLEQLSSDIGGLRDIDAGAGEGVAAEIETSLDAIVADLGSVKTDAEAELSEPVAQLQGSLDAVSTQLDAAKADEDLSAEEAQGLLDSLAGVSTSWTSLKEAAPDCDL